jgi:hypothetical protein
MRVVIGLLLAACVNGLIEKLSVTNDPRPHFHIESFGFEKGGVFEAKLDDFALMVPHDWKVPPDGTFDLAFVLQRSPSDVGVKVDGSACFHTNFVSPEDHVFELKSRTQWGSQRYNVDIKEPGYYHLYFSNCVAGTHTTFNLVTTEYNIDLSTGVKSYLSTGLSSLPTYYFVLFFVFVCMNVYWVYMLKNQWSNARSIHHLMTAVCVLKTITLFLEALRYYTIRSSGVHDGWSAAFYVFEFLKGMLMFTVIILIGTGWSYLKPFLTERDKQMVLAVLVTQAAVNIAMVAVDESTPGSLGGVRWRDILHFVDIVCCCVILFPVVWSISHLRAAAGSDSKAARNVQRLKNFRWFYLLIVSYIYFTRIVLFLLEALLPYDLTWVGPVFKEIAAVALYGVTGYLFRPQDANPYLALSKDDDDVVENDEL